MRPLHNPFRLRQDRVPALLRCSGTRHRGMAMRDEIAKPHSPYVINREKACEEIERFLQITTGRRRISAGRGDIPPTIVRHSRERACEGIGGARDRIVIRWVLDDARRRFRCRKGAGLAICGRIATGWNGGWSMRAVCFRGTIGRVWFGASWRIWTWAISTRRFGSRTHGAGPAVLPALWLFATLEGVGSGDLCHGGVLAFYAADPSTRQPS